MTQRTIIQLIDDIDGSEGDETHAFTVDGTSYEIDLSAQNGKRFQEALLPFIEHGRRIRPGGGFARATTLRTPRVGPVSSTINNNLDPKIVRAWALANGYEISSRGRVSADIVAAYLEATRG